MKARHATTTPRVLCLFTSLLAFCSIYFASINGAAFARKNAEPIATPTPGAAAVGTAGASAATASNPNPKPTPPQPRPTTTRPNNTSGHNAGGASERNLTGDNDASDTQRNEATTPGGEQQNAGNAKNQNKPGLNNHSDDTAQPDSWLDTLLYWGIRILGVLGVLLVLGLIGYGIKMFVDGSRTRTEAYFAGMKRRQDEHASKTREALVTLNNHMAELQSEIRELRRSLQDDNRAILDGVRRAGASSAAYAGSSSGYAAQSPRFEKEEPAFPAAAEDYLNRNRRSAVVVKPDFQNGILVQDAEGQGEFMLVRDHSAPDELLYVIPRTGYFQTKQDFLTYYAKYYECARPSAGAVWIVQPAVVDRVSGGWALREKGELEVR
jgi:hypothetical protein